MRWAPRDPSLPVVLKILFQTSAFLSKGLSQSAFRDASKSFLFERERRPCKVVTYRYHVPVDARETGCAVVSGLSAMKR